MREPRPAAAPPLPLVDHTELKAERTTTADPSIFLESGVASFFIESIRELNELFKKIKIDPENIKPKQIDYAKYFLNLIISLDISSIFIRPDEGDFFIEIRTREGSHFFQVPNHFLLYLSDLFANNNQLLEWLQCLDLILYSPKKMPFTADRAAACLAKIICLRKMDKNEEALTLAIESLPLFYENENAFENIIFQVEKIIIDLLSSKDSIFPPTNFTHITESKFAERPRPTKNAIKLTFNTCYDDYLDILIHSLKILHSKEEHLIIITAMLDLLMNNSNAFQLPKLLDTILNNPFYATHMASTKHSTEYIEFIRHYNNLSTKEKTDRVQIILCFIDLVALHNKACPRKKAPSNYDTPTPPGFDKLRLPFILNQYKYSKKNLEISLQEKNFEKAAIAYKNCTDTLAWLIEHSYQLSISFSELFVEGALVYYTASELFLHHGISVSPTSNLHKDFEYALKICSAQIDYAQRIGNKDQEKECLITGARYCWIYSLINLDMLDTKTSLAAKEACLAMLEAAYGISITSTKKSSIQNDLPLKPPALDTIHDYISSISLVFFSHALFNQIEFKDLANQLNSIYAAFHLQKQFEKMLPKTEASSAPKPKVAVAASTAPVIIKPPVRKKIKALTVSQIPNLTDDFYELSLSFTRLQTEKIQAQKHFDRIKNNINKYLIMLDNNQKKYPKFCQKWEITTPLRKELTSHLEKINTFPVVDLEDLKQKFREPTTLNKTSLLDDLKTHITNAKKATQNLQASILYLDAQTIPLESAIDKIEKSTAREPVVTEAKITKEAKTAAIRDKKINHGKGKVITPAKKSAAKKAETTPQPKAPAKLAPRPTQSADRFFTFSPAAGITPIAPRSTSSSITVAFCPEGYEAKPIDKPAQPPVTVSTPKTKPVLHVVKNLRLNAALNHLLSMHHTSLRYSPEDAFRSSPEEKNIKDNITHLSHLYDIIRCFEALNQYGNAGGETTPDLPQELSTHVRNMVKHHGAAEAEKENVLKTVAELIKKMPHEFTAMKKRPGVYALSPPDLSRLRNAYDIDHADKKREAVPTPLDIEKTPLYAQLAEFHTARTSNDLSESQRITRIINLLPTFDNIILTIKKIHPAAPTDMPSKAKFEEHYLPHLNALKMLLTIFGELCDKETCLKKQTESIPVALKKLYNFLFHCCDIRNQVGHRFPATRVALFSESDCSIQSIYNICDMTKTLNISKLKAISRASSEAVVAALAKIGSFPIPTPPTTPTTPSVPPAPAVPKGP